MAQELEIMAPAGSWETLRTAIKAGANSVYFGIQGLNMRARAANNFTIKDLKEIVKFCNEHNVKTYLTVNTILYDEDMDLMKKICDSAKESGITAIIAADIAAIQYANSIELKVHISTQANVCNLEAVKFYSRFADVIVLARELNLEQVKHICDEIKKQDIRGLSGGLLKIEVFVHGALCVSISGKCYMSLAQYNHSANRGDCLQTCRRSYKVIDEQTGDELVVDNKYIMSPSDLCTIEFLDKLIEAGATVFKIEGRGKPAEYVYTVVKCYREAADSIISGTYTKEKIDNWMKELKSVYNRGFWEGGYYLGKKLNEWSGKPGNQATHEKIFLGLVENYYSQKSIGQFLIQSDELHEGDELMVTGSTTGIVKLQAEGLIVKGNKVSLVKKQNVVTMPIPEKIRKNDKLYVIRKKKF